MEITTSQIIAKLKLKSNPEGGFYTETFRDKSVLLDISQLPDHYKVDRPISTNIYFLVPSGSVSLIHRIPCSETWNFYLGDPLTVAEMNEIDGSVKLTNLGSNIIEENQVLQYTVPPNVWFGAFPANDFKIFRKDVIVKNPPIDAEKHFSLVGCTCAPAFEFADFELAKHSDLISLFPAHKSLISLLTLPD
ncbi:RmlC-like jelly roll fold [Heracleum sosnowskyi]|uniref:RmlC-like jelly roll fold n=1 Tax=Heracleum sosnowskyi TaxID=360622 RepID=A0AAD8GVC5_9APIA|nr:RmlC-like jelly roll fold [Heracleum sosnowskyi]